MRDAGDGRPLTAVEAIEASQLRGDRGRVDVHARSLDDLTEALRRTRRGGWDATVVVNDLTAATLGLVSEWVCDLVVDQDVPVAFRHRGRFLQLAAVELPGTGVERSSDCV